MNNGTLVSLNSDGTFPSTPIPVTHVGPFPQVGVTTDHRLMVSSGIAVPSASNVATFTEGTKTVTTAGTPLTLVASPTYVAAVIISPLRTNTGSVYIGTLNTSLSQSILGPFVIEAPAGKSINLAAIYIDVTVNGEGVSYLTIS